MMEIWLPWLHAHLRELPGALPVLLVTPSVVTQSGAAQEEDRGEQDFSLQPLTAFLSKPPVPTSLSLPGGTWCLLKSCFSLDWEEREGAETCKLFYLDIFLAAEECCPLPDGCTSQGTGKELCPVPGCGLMLLLSSEMQRLRIITQGMQRLRVITQGSWAREGVGRGALLCSLCPTAGALPWAQWVTIAQCGEQTSVPGDELGFW